jgi:hypothetical protein
MVPEGYWHFAGFGVNNFMQVRVGKYHGYIH